MSGPVFKLTYILISALLLRTTTTQRSKPDAYSSDTSCNIEIDIDHTEGYCGEDYNYTFCHDSFCDTHSRCNLNDDNSFNRVHFSCDIAPSSCNYECRARKSSIDWIAAPIVIFTIFWLCPYFYLWFIGMCTNHNVASRFDDVKCLGYVFLWIFLPLILSIMHCCRDPKKRTGICQIAPYDPRVSVPPSNQAQINQLIQDGSLQLSHRPPEYLAVMAPDGQILTVSNPRHSNRAGQGQNQNNTIMTSDNRLSIQGQKVQPQNLTTMSQQTYVMGSNGVLIPVSNRLVQSDVPQPEV